MRPSHESSHRATTYRSALIDVRLELIAFALELVDAALHHVTDTDDAEEVAVLDHRQMPDSTLGHDRGNAVHCVCRNARVHQSGHDLGNLDPEDRKRTRLNSRHKCAD